MSFEQLPGPIHFSTRSRPCAAHNIPARCGDTCFLNPVSMDQYSCLCAIAAYNVHVYVRRRGLHDQDSIPINPFLGTAVVLNIKLLSPSHSPSTRGNNRIRSSLLCGRIKNCQILAVNIVKSDRIPIVLATNKMF
jgi:hypothetical protein